MRCRLEQQGRQSVATQDIFRAGSAATDIAAASTSRGAAAAGAGAPGTDMGLLVGWPERVIQCTWEGPVIEQVHAQFNPLSGPRETPALQVIQDFLSFPDSTQS